MFNFGESSRRNKIKKLEEREREILGIEEPRETESEAKIKSERKGALALDSKEKQSENIW